MLKLDLDSLQIHNDVRVNPQRPAARVFQKTQGYRLTWYPPHLFLIECDVKVQEGKKVTTSQVQRWFATTNVESWTVCGDPAFVKEAFETHLGVKAMETSPSRKAMPQPKPRPSKPKESTEPDPLQSRNDQSTPKES